MTFENITLAKISTVFYLILKNLIALHDILRFQITIYFLVKEID